MGLDDLIPDDVDSQSSGSSSSRTQTQQERDVVIGKEPYKKEFDEDKWKEVKSVLTNEMGYNVNWVLNNLPAEERYEVLHEAVMMVNENLEPEEAEHRSTDRCIVCGNATDQVEAEIPWLPEGESVCFHHTVAQLEKELKERDV